MNLRNSWAGMEFVYSSVNLILKQLNLKNYGTYKV